MLVLNLVLLDSSLGFSTDTLNSLVSDQPETRASTSNVSALYLHSISYPWTNLSESASASASKVTHHDRPQRPLPNSNGVHRPRHHAMLPLRRNTDERPRQRKSSHRTSLTHLPSHPPPPYNTSTSTPWPKPTTLTTPTNPPHSLYSSTPPKETTPRYPTTSTPSTSSPTAKAPSNRPHPPSAPSPQN